jgi:hypothetical protein
MFLFARGLVRLRLFAWRIRRRLVDVHGAVFTLCGFPGRDAGDGMSYRPDCKAVKGEQPGDSQAQLAFAENEIRASQKETAWLRRCASKGDGLDGRLGVVA